MNNFEENTLYEIKKNVAHQVGQRVRKFRKHKKLSQSDLASLVGMDRQYLYKIETAKVTPNIGTISILAYAMGISLFELFEDVSYR